MKMVFHNYRPRYLRAGLSSSHSSYSSSHSSYSSSSLSLSSPSTPRSVALLSILLVLTFIGVSGASNCYAQLTEDIRGFLRNGNECYQCGDLAGAQLEFENVLLLDPGNFEARLWLTQVYTDRKDFAQARRMLRLACAQAPDHPRVQALQQMLQSDTNTETSTATSTATSTKMVPASATVDDMVVFETVTLLGSGTRLRPYGLVVPERRIKSGDDQTQPTTFEEVVLVPDEPVPVLEMSESISGPLMTALKAWRQQGLEPGLQAYFELVMANLELGAEDDHGLLTQGMKIFQKRLDQDANDGQARYFVGMIQFFNGQIESAEATLKGIRGETQFGPQLAQVVKEIDRRRTEEEERLAAVKREEERLEKERQDQLLAEQAAQAAAMAANTAGVTAPKPREGEGTGNTGGSGPSDTLHAEGYELYKKGQLDAAISKFEEAIRGKVDEPKYHYHLGLALTDKALAGDMRAFDQAIESFKQVEILDQGSKMANDAQVMIKDIIAAKSSLMR